MRSPGEIFDDITLFGYLEDIWVMRQSKSLLGKYLYS